MRFESTRGESPKVSAPEALLAGAAPDGGLYLQDALPRLGHLMDAGLDYAGLAAAVFTALLPGFPEEELHQAAMAAYPSPPWGRISCWSSTMAPPPPSRTWPCRPCRG